MRFSASTALLLVFGRAVPGAAQGQAGTDVSGHNTFMSQPLESLGSTWFLVLLLVVVLALVVWSWRRRGRV